MHILLLDLGPSLRGGQRQVYYLARYLARQPDVRAVTACPRKSPLAELLRSEGAAVLPLPGRAVWNPLLLPLLIGTAIRTAPLLLHTHDAHAATLGRLVKTLRPDTVLIHSRRVSYLPRSAGKYATADAVVGVSAAVTEQMIRAGVPRSRTRTIHSGIDPARYRSRCTAGTGPFRFVSIGALTPQKGYPTLLEAAALLDREFGLPEWEVRIVGEGPLRSSLEERIRALNLSKRVYSAGLQDSRVELPLADALVAPSADGEGSSAVVKEGWAVGLPVICSALPSNLELIRHGDNGLVFPPGHAAALAAAMRRCLLEPEAVRTLVEGGRKTLPDFTDERMARAYLELYRELYATRFRNACRD